MPVTPVRNMIYQTLLPVLAPSYRLLPLSVQGHTLFYQKDFQSLLQRHHAMGGAVILSTPSQISLILSSIELSGHQAHPDTYFRLASLTKTACSICVLRCIEKGLFSLQTPVNELLPQSHDRLKDMKVYHLLSHTSGMQDTDHSQLCLRQHRPYTDVLDHEETCIAPPGAAFHYCNFSFGLLGSVLESVTGASISEVFRSFLFSPLDMSATLNPAELNDEQIMPMTRILPYRKNSDIRRTAAESVPLETCDPLFHYGPVQGSMFATVNALHRMLSVLTSIKSQASSSLLSPASIQAMKTTYGRYGAVSPTLSYCLGLLRIDDPSISSHPVFGHQGFAYGAVHGAFMEDSTDRCVIFLNGGCSEARKGRLASVNYDLLKLGFKEMSTWSSTK